MKLKYEKPSLMIEKFEMCQNIAYGCTAEYTEGANFRNQNECAWNHWEFDIPLWSNGSNNGCEADPEEDSICYNNPESVIVAFAS